MKILPPQQSRTLNYAEVSANRSRNPARSWHEASSPGRSDLASTRFGDGPFFPVYGEPRFSLQAGSSVFTIGSCFARNVEQELAKAGFRIPTLDIDVPEEAYSRDSRFANSILNKYTAHSTADEIMRGLGLATYPDRGLMPLANGKWIDPQASATQAMDRDLAETVRDRLDVVLASLPQSAALIVTLGLTETWLDAETGLIFNGLHPAAPRAYRDRLRFFNATPQDCYDSMAGALSALHDRCPDMKVIVTVSPVPMRQTFTDMDVVAANTYSKATLRVTAQMLYETFDFVDYFPSYEMVTNSPRATSWFPDQIHVSFDLVAAVIGTFVERYVTKRDSRRHLSSTP
jgi:hypothetical protein